jgi:hypothetical protein
MARPALSLLLTVLVIGLPVASIAECMGPYPPSMVRAFNQNCAKDPKMLSFCSCIMDDVQKNIPLADFIEIGNSAGGINDDPRFIKASKKCTPLMSGAPAAAVTPALQPATAAPASPVTGR